MTQEELNDYLGIALKHFNFNEATTWIEKGANINDCEIFVEERFFDEWEDKWDTKYIKYGALSFAVNRENMAMIDFAIKNKVDIDGYSIYLAVKSNKLEIVKIVLNRYKETSSYGDFYIKNRMSYYAEAWNEGFWNLDFEIVLFLVELGADINSYEYHFKTILDVARRKKDEKSIEFLKTLGAKTYNELKEGKTEC